MKHKQKGFGFFGFLSVLAVVIGLSYIFGPVTETTCTPPSEEAVKSAELFNQTFSSPTGLQVSAEEKCTTRIVR